MSVEPKPVSVLKRDSEELLGEMRYLLEKEGDEIVNLEESDIDFGRDHQNKRTLFRLHAPYVLSIPDFVACLREASADLQYVLSQSLDGSDARTAVEELKKRIDAVLEGAASKHTAPCREPKKASKRSQSHQEA